MIYNYYRQWGDGKCDPGCFIRACSYDNGDCLQLCFAEELTNCTLDKIFDDKCDQECDNEYCSKYPWGGNFDPIQAELVESSECDIIDINKSTVNSSCSTLSIYSPYIDANVPEYANQAPVCAPDWVGDGFCDDACRIDECLQDNEDCNEGCVDDYCSNVYYLWLYLQSILGNEYKFNHSIVCKEIIPLYGDILDGVEDQENLYNMSGNGCSDLLDTYDFNDDGYINFRESIPLLIDGVDGTSKSEKSNQVNCSVCIGMQYYNV